MAGRELKQLFRAYREGDELAFRRAAQEIVEDRLAAAVAELFDLLADADARERRLLVEQSLVGDGPTLAAQRP